MNNKGFFSIIIAISVLELQFSLLEQKKQELEQLGPSITKILETQKTMFKRTELEQNIDFLIQETMQKELALQNYDPEKIKKKIIENLLEFTKNYSDESEKKTVSFFIEENKQKKELQTELLENTTKVIVIAKKPVIFAEFVFTGSENKNIFFKAQIKHNSFSTEFMLPYGYSIKSTRDIQ